MPDVVCGALNVAGHAIQTLIIDRMKRYVNLIKHCDLNLKLLLKDLEKLRVEKDDIDEKVLYGKEKSEKLTGKAALWLVSVRDLTKDKAMKKLMNEDMEIAKVMLSLMKDDLKDLVENDGEICELVVKVMKDITKGKRTAEIMEVFEEEEKDKEVGQVLEKLLQETMEEFKNLMKNDAKMAITAMHLLENHKEKLDMLTKKDKEVADIIMKAREMSHEEETQSDYHDDEKILKDNVLFDVNNLRENLRNLLKPVGQLIVSEELVKTLPEKLRLGMEAIRVVIGNIEGLKGELLEAENHTRHCSNCFGCEISMKYFRDRHDMSVAAEAMLSKIKYITGSKPANNDLTRPKRRREMEDIHTHSVGLESRSELVQKIVKALSSEDLNVVGVYGMGGSGKTSLGKEVANSKAKDIFDTIVMVEISETPNIERIQDQIAAGLGLDLHDVHGRSQKAIHLYNRLKPGEKSGGKDDNNCKKTLLVLDNIWHKINLHEVGIPPEHCKLLLTSREKNVCKAMDVQKANIFEVGLLNEKEAKVLFQFQVQKNVHSGEHKSVADRLLEKCGGLPLAIVATANSLKGKALPFWRQFAEELEKPISCQISGARYETFSILRTSYEVMESEEKKKFFLLACLSSAGSSISIDNLMRYGIGLALFQNVNKLSEAIDQAQTWAEELVSSSMLLEGDPNVNVKIHDVVRESAMSFASKNDQTPDRQMFLVDAIPRWIWDETFNKYTGISLLSRANYARLSGVKAELLQILLLKGDGNHSSFIESNFFQGMANLKVLVMQTMNFKKGLPESMGKLRDLKTLHLEGCKLGDIKLIGNFESLLVLSLRGSFLEGFPDEIGMLHNLRVLDMSECECEQPRIPANVIANLSLLEGLYLFHSSFEWEEAKTKSNDTGTSDGASMEELNKLDNLNVLEMSFLKRTRLLYHPQLVKNLDKFKIRAGYFGFVGQPSQRMLKISQLYDIDLKNDNCLKALFKKADHLSIKDSTYSASFSNIVPDLDEEGLSDLSCLNLDDIRSLRKICDGKAPSRMFFNLRQLEVLDSRQLEDLLPVNPLPHKLTTIKISGSDDLKFIFYDNGDLPPPNKDAGVNKVIELPCLKSLNLSYNSSLLSVVKLSNIDDSRCHGFFNSKVKFPALEDFSLTHNKSIVKLWDEESNIHSFRNLRVLRVDSCEGLLSLGPPSVFAAFVHLESLEITSCVQMQAVISKESENQEISEEIITFPKLKLLQITDSCKLKRFYAGSFKLEFPRLEKLELHSLGLLDNFASFESSTVLFHEKIEFPYLKELQVTKINAKVMALWKFRELMPEGEGEGEGDEIRSNPVPNLRKLTIGKIILPPIITQALSCLTLPSIGGVNIGLSVSGNEGSTWTYSQFSKLEELDVCGEELDVCGGLNSIEQLFEDDQDGSSTAMVIFCGQLKRLKLRDLLDLKVISLHLFTNLRCLHIWNLNWKYLFSVDGGLEQLQLLEELYIVACCNLEVITGDGDKDDAFVFPRLKILILGCLECLLKFSSIENVPFHFPSLEVLDIKVCKKLETIWSGPFIAPKLREIRVWKCHSLKCVLAGEPNYVVELQSLQYMDIRTCYNMESFSSIPLRAAKLRELVVEDCIEMKWFLLGNTNNGADLELPSLEKVVIGGCRAMQSFSPAVLRASKLALATVDYKDYPMLESEDLNQLVQTLLSKQI